LAKHYLVSERGHLDYRLEPYGCSLFSVGALCGNKDAHVTGTIKHFKPSAMHPSH
jgi:hypothetical protein